MMEDNTEACHGGLMRRPQSSFTVLLEELEMSVDLHTRIELQKKGRREWAE